MDAVVNDVQFRRALRFLTAGSVDDGKSTLIGRLLYEARAIAVDQIDALQRQSTGDEIDLSLVTDGLEAEREQGITIDVAYRYFATSRRKFIIADAPGHVQYTRNMVTAAAGSDAAIVLVDVTKLEWRTKPLKLLEQTRRHALLLHKLRVPSIVFAINKLDTLTHPADAYTNVRQALLHFADEAGITEVAAVLPISALRGDSIREPLNTPWYEGPSLMQLLEAMPNTADRIDGPPRMPVQYVAREEKDHAGVLRVCWGRVAEGQVRVGDTLAVFPSGEQAVVAGLRKAGGKVPTVMAGQSAGVILDRPVDVSRGDWLAAPGILTPVRQFAATLAWLDTEPALTSRKYWIRHANSWVQGRVTDIVHCLDIHTLEPVQAHQLNVNDIGKVVIELQQPLPLEPFSVNRLGGALIMVDPGSHRTSGVLLVDDGAEPSVRGSSR